MPTCKDPGRILTLTSTMLKVRKRAEMIQAICKHFVWKKILKTDQVHVWKNGVLRQVTVVGLTANAIERPIQTMLTFFPLPYEHKAYWFQNQQIAASYSSFSVIKMIPATQPRSGSGKHCVTSKGQIKGLSVNAHAQEKTPHVQPVREEGYKLECQ